MITLSLLICNMAATMCFVITPHSKPSYLEPFKTTRECNDKGRVDKDKLIAYYKSQRLPIEVKFRCTNWDPRA